MQKQQKSLGLDLVYVHFLTTIGGHYNKQICPFHNTTRIPSQMLLLELYNVSQTSNNMLLLTVTGTQACTQHIVTRGWRQD